MGLVRRMPSVSGNAARSLFERALRRNNKNFFDQSLDEIKLLKFLNLQVVRTPLARVRSRARTCTDTRVPGARAHAPTRTRAHTHTRARTHARIHTRAHARTHARARAHCGLQPLGVHGEPVWLPQDPVEHSHIIRLYDFFYFKANLTPPALWRPPPSHWLQPSLPRTRRAPARFRGPTPRAALQEHLFIVCELMHENL